MRWKVSTQQQVFIEDHLVALSGTSTVIKFHSSPVLQSSHFSEELKMTCRKKGSSGEGQVFWKTQKSGNALDLEIT